MKTIALVNQHTIILVILAACMNSFFLYMHNPHIYFAITQAHGQIGYHLYQCNKIGIDPLLTQQVNKQMHEQQQLIDYNTVSCDTDHEHDSFPINDTIGYGVLLGLLWKITGSLCFFDVQILQIILFSFLMLYYYQLAYLLFGAESIAFLCGLAHLLFFPLLAYNVMPVRDIWAYYGLLILAYATVAFYNKQLTSKRLWAFVVFFSICLWMRPTLVLAALLFSLFAVAQKHGVQSVDESDKNHAIASRLRRSVATPRRVAKEGSFGGISRETTALKSLGASFALRTYNRTKTCIYLATLWAVTGALFWIPSIYYNQINYDRYFVSPAGQSLLEGLGELPNPWGHRLNDEYVNEFISAKYQLRYGTPEFDEAAMQEFTSCVKENPFHYITTLFYRLPDILLPALQWIFYTQSPYATCTTLWQKLSLVISCPEQVLNFFARHIWMRLYLLLSYVGLYFILRNKQYTAFWIVLICLLSGLSTYPSHIEYRYIVPFYWILSLSLGYLWYYVVNSFNKHKKVNHAKNNLIHLFID